MQAVETESVQEPHQEGRGESLSKERQERSRQKVCQGDGPQVHSVLGKLSL